MSKIKNGLLLTESRRMLDALKTLDDRCVGVVKEGEPLHRTNGSLHPPHPWYRTIETFTQLQFRSASTRLSGIDTEVVVTN
uniref:Uncharacterized protein n=1 Tax=Oryza meridionalis TaxID=40149 RepID=A0A0E0EBE8_9ORYZ